MNFKDLNCRYLKDGGGLGELGSLLEPTKLIHGYSKVGARCRLDLVPIDCRNSCGGTFYCAVSSVVYVFVFSSNTPRIGFHVSRGLSQLIIKSSLGKHLGGDRVSVRMSVMVAVIVLVEPFDSTLGSSSKMGSMESPSSYRICTMLIAGAN